jgi:biotin operon repressor
MGYVNQPHGLGETWVPVRLLRAEAGMSTDRLARHMEALRDAGWLVLKEPASGRRAARYQLELPGLSDTDSTDASESSSDTDSTDATQDRSVPAQTRSVPVSRRSVPDSGNRTRGNQGKNPPTPRLASGSSGVVGREESAIAGEVRGVLRTAGVHDARELDWLIDRVMKDPETRSPVRRAAQSRWLTWARAEWARLQRSRAPRCCVCNATRADHHSPAYADHPFEEIA